MTTDFYSSATKFKIHENDQLACDVEGYLHCFYLIKIHSNRPWLPFPPLCNFRTKSHYMLCEFINNMAIKHKPAKFSYSKLIFWCVRTHSSTCCTAYTDASKSHYIIPVYITVSWRWTFGFETCRRHKKIKINILIFNRCVLFACVL